MLQCSVETNFFRLQLVDNTVAACVSVPKDFHSKSTLKRVLNAGVDMLSPWRAGRENCSCTSRQGNGVFLVKLDQLRNRSECLRKENNMWIITPFYNRISFEEQVPPPPLDALLSVKTLLMINHSLWRRPTILCILDSSSSVCVWVWVSSAEWQFGDCHQITIHQIRNHLAEWPNGNLVTNSAFGHPTNFSQSWWMVIQWQKVAKLPFDRSHSNSNTNGVSGILNSHPFYSQIYSKTK